MYGDKQDDLPSMLVLAPCLGGAPIDEVVDGQQRVAQLQLVHGATVEIPQWLRAGSESSAECKTVLERAGMKFLGESTTPLLQKVELPSGWRREAHPESTRDSWLVDDKGRRRALIYYLQQFWDPAAHLTLLPRFTIEFDQERGRQNIVLVDIKDGDRVIHTINGGSFATSEEHYAAQGPAREQAKAWLTQRYPDWQRVSAYWD